MNNSQDSKRQLKVIEGIEEIKIMCHPFFSELKKSYGDKVNHDNIAKDFQKLINIENYIKFLEEKHGLSGMLSTSQLFKIDEDLFDFMIDLYGYNSLPTVLNKEDYEKLKNNRLAIYSNKENVLVEFDEEYYRGSPKLIYHANVMCDYDYFHGTGVNSNGLYAAPKFIEAKQYANTLSYSKEEEPIIRFKINTKKIIEDWEIFKLLNSVFSYITMPILSNKQTEARLLALNYFADSLSPADKHNFIELFKSDFGLLATYLDYDCISFSVGQAICILNRGIMNFEQNEFDRVCNQTKIYKDGQIDHKLKSINNFKFEK